MYLELLEFQHNLVSILSIRGFSTCFFKNICLISEKFDQVTVLFSDIVTFTNIASACPAMDVVSMLNNLYHRFDARTTEHGVYKVLLLLHGTPK